MVETRWTVRKVRPRTPADHHWAVYDADDGGKMVCGLGKMNEAEAREARELLIAGKLDPYTGRPVV